MNYAREHGLVRNCRMMLRQLRNKLTCVRSNIFRLLRERIGLGLLCLLRSASGAHANIVRQLIYLLLDAFDARSNKCLLRFSFEPSLLLCRFPTAFALFPTPVFRRPSLHRAAYIQSKIRHRLLPLPVQREFSWLSIGLAPNLSKLCVLFPFDRETWLFL